MRGKRWSRELNGPRREEHDRSRKRLGIVREVAGLMQTPEGDFVCLFHEAEDLAKTFQMLATSDGPYDQWFREKVADLHGITAEMIAGPLPAKVFIDYRGSGG
jgi:hypothetical protein